MGTHAGIIVNLNGVPFIYHMQYGPKFDLYTKSYRRKKPVLECFKHWSTTYNGNIWVYKAKEESDRDKTIQFIRETYDIDFTINQIYWFNTILKLPLKHNRMICTDLVGKYLRHIGVKDINHPLTPTDIENILTDSGRYLEPEMVKKINTNI